GEIILQDEREGLYPVSPRALSALFAVHKKSIRCVLFSACYSEQHALAVAQHIDCVIGMSRAISNHVAIQFAGAFYLALGYGASVKEAFTEDCIQIGFERLSVQNTP